MADSELRHHRRHDLNGIFNRRTDTQAATQTRSTRSGVLQHLLKPLHERRAFFEQPLPRIGERNRARRTVEQGRAQHVLQTANLKTHLRTRNVQTFGGGREAARIGDGQESAQQVEIAHGGWHDWFELDTSIVLFVLFF